MRNSTCRSSHLRPVTRLTTPSLLALPPCTRAPRVAGSEREEVSTHYRNVVAHIAAAKAGSPVELAALYEGVRLATD